MGSELIIFIILILIAPKIIREIKQQIKRKKRYKQHKTEYESLKNSNYTYTQAESHTPAPEPPQPEPEESKEETYDFSYMPYKKRLLLTKTEYAFYTVLARECYKRKLLVCPKVRLEDLVYITDKEHPFKYRGYVKSRHVDFVITDIRLNALAAIELDDPSHDTYKAAKTDRFKNELFKTINVPLIRVKTGTDYTTQITIIFDNLNFNANTTMTKTQP